MVRLGGVDGTHPSPSLIHARAHTHTSGAVSLPLSLFTPDHLFVFTEHRAPFPASCLPLPHSPHSHPTTPSCSHDQG